MSVFKACGPECVLCDCGRSDSKCKFAASKQRGRKKALGILSAVIKPPKKKRNKRNKKKK